VMTATTKQVKNTLSRDPLVSSTERLKASN